MILTMQLFFYIITIMLRDPCGSTGLLLVKNKNKIKESRGPELKQMVF